MITNHQNTMRLPTDRLIFLFTALISLVVLAVAATSPNRDVDLLKRLIDPPTLSKRTPALLRRARFGCDKCALFPEAATRLGYGTLKLTDAQWLRTVSGTIILLPGGTGMLFRWNLREYVGARMPERGDSLW